MSRNMTGERASFPSQRYESSLRSNDFQSNTREGVMTSNGDRKRKWGVLEHDQEHQQASGSLECKTKIVQCLEADKEKRQRVKLEEQIVEGDVREEDRKYSADERGLQEGGSDICGEQDEDIGTEKPRRIKNRHHDPSEEGKISEDSTKEVSLEQDEKSEEEELDWERFDRREPADEEERSEDDASEQDEESETEELSDEISEEGQNKPSVADQDNQNDSTSAPQPRMSAKEKRWWAMDDGALYEEARSSGFRKKDADTKRSGRIVIIRWLCKINCINPYVAPIVPSISATSLVAGPFLRKDGAESHPEAILRTSDPALQRKIDKKAKVYRESSRYALLEIAKQRSYTLLKDSKGKMAGTSKKALAIWLAAWDVLKSPREKKWWLGDGLDVINVAKAMGYQGPTLESASRASRKYDAIVWLRTRSEDAEVEIERVLKQREQGPRATKGSRRVNN